MPCIADKAHCACGQLRVADIRLQARAHALLKGKDAELRDARAVAEAHFSEALRNAESALAQVHRELDQVLGLPCICSGFILAFGLL